MRTDVKIGIAVGVLVLLVAAIYVASTNKKNVANNGNESGMTKTDGVTPEIKIELEPAPSGLSAPTPPPAHLAPVGATTPSAVSEPLSTSVAPTALSPALSGVPSGTVPPTNDTIYVTVRGDTFYSIAQQKYGNGNRYAVMLIRANPGVSESNIPAGTVLKLPAVPADMTMSGTGHAATGTYTVAAGDTLWVIAQKHYGDAKYVDLLISANPGARSGVLRVGQTLTLPPKPQMPDAARPVVALPAGAKDYTVTSGDTLSSIAERHYGSGKYWKQIASANPDTKDGSSPLKIGQKLVIPVFKDVTPTSGPAGLARSATTRPSGTPVARRTSPPDVAVSSTGSSAPERPDFSGRLR